MRLTVTPRARRREDRAGDPLDGLVNLFDLGIVLAVAFLLSALSSLKLDGALQGKSTGRTAADAVTVAPGQKVAPLPAKGARTVGRGTEVGSVYRLSDGRLIYVTGKPGASGGGSTATTTTTMPAP